MQTTIKSILILIIASFSFSKTEAQKIFVELHNSENAKPISYAYVNLYNNTSPAPLATVLTDDNGKAELDTINCPCKLEIVATGYEPVIRQINSFAEKNNLKFSLIKKFASLDEVVVTGVTKPTKPQDALSLYKIISSETINAQGAITLNDALNTQLNMNVQNDAILGAGINMQGLQGDNVKILVDGVTVNGREGQNIDLGQLNLYNTDRVEIVQGPMSVMYGTDALGGVINLITKEHLKQKEIVATANYESVGKYNFNLSVAHRLGDRHSLTIGGGRNFFQGWKYIDTVEPHRQLLFKPKEQYLANIGYGYQAPSGFKIHFASDFADEKVTNRGVAKVTPFEARGLDEYYKTIRSINRLLLTGKIGKKGFWESTNGISYYMHVKNTYVKDLVTLENVPSGEKLAQDTSHFTDVTLRATMNNSLKKINYTIGYDIWLQHGLSQKISDDAKNIGDYAAFALLSVPIFKDKLTAQGGLRTAYNTQYNNPLIPSFNLLLKPTNKWQIRASYAKGFRAPTLKEMYLQFVDNNHNILGNTNLKPEDGEHFQASSSYQLYQVKTNYLQLLLTGYYNNVKNGIVLVNLHPDIPTNIDYKYGNLSHLRNAIGNLQLEGQWHDVHVTGGYAYRYTLAEKGSYSSFHASEVTASVQYFYRPAKLSLNLFYKFTGEQPALLTDITGSATYNGSQPSYHWLDASLERKFWNKRVQVIAGVKNILNVQTLQSEGFTATSAHSGNGAINFLPRSLFTTLKLNLE